MLGDSQQPTFGIPPPARGGKRGRGGRGARGGYGGRRQPLPLGGGAEADGVDVAMADAYPDNNNDNNNQRDDDERAAAEDHGGGFNSIEFRNDDVLVNDQIDSKLGFERYQEGPTRLGWLVNMHATTVPDEERNSAKAAVDYYFLEQDGGSFKCTLLYKPYFYVVCAPGCETEVEEWLVRRFDRFVDGVETVEREDLQMANHLTGCKRRLVKIVFRNVQDLLAVRRELQPIIRRNEKRSDLMNAYNDGDGGGGIREIEDSLLEMREFDVPYYLRVAIDKAIRVGVWYDVSADAGEITLARREDLVQRADPVVLAYDIETTKLPLKFPDASTDMIMMISYMIDGQGYLITNREVVAEDIDDFDYTPTREFPGPFIIFNEPDERAVIQRFFDHICDAKPTVLATYNGDSFDWPFVDARAKHHGIDMKMETGWYRDEADEYKCRSCVHMDCFRWVKRDSYLPVGSHGLKAVTTAKLGYNPMEIDPEDMTRFAAEQPQTLAQYSVSDAVATYYLYMKYVHPFIFSLCNIIPLNPDEVLRKGSGTLCETLLMVEAFNARVAIPNKHADPLERTWDGHLVETETYVGGHVEALEAGVFRSDINMHFRVVPEGPQRLLDELDRALRFSIEVEGKLSLDEIENYDQVRGEIAARLEDLRDRPVRNEPPLIYHLDVAAMYPNIILTNRLQPDAIVSDAVCASCDFNVPGKNCDRRMPWLWRGEFFPPKRAEVNMLRGKLQGELFPPDGRARAGAPPRTYDQLPPAERASELGKRVKDYSKKVYHRLRETKVEEREAVICQRENPFYVDTVRNFRDRRYVYKGLLKKEKRKLDGAVAAGDNTLIDSGKKLVVLYDSLQLAHKCILNSFYGYVMRKGARWHSLEMAGVVCLTGSRIIQMARQRVEQLGRPLELDTDGIWCTLPGSFPENFSFRLRDGKGKFGISYPCTMLNHLVFDKFTNHQYQDLVDAAGHAYSMHSENSIFFEVDGPYRAMILPSSKEEDKLLKKRYAVFNDDGTLAELKGFEVKRRGELKLIKIFQSQIFKVFLQGSTLEECYGAVAKVANQWLDILFSRAKDLPDDELFDLITENRSMSKALESYGAMKSTSICTARRLAEFLGDEMVKDKGLACKFVISRLPRDQPVSERAVPVAIFSADPLTKRQFLRRWLRDSALEHVDIRDILDWDYYLERFGSVIQKLITIPAAMQGVPNPVPRIRHPDWLTKRVNSAMNTHKQRHITDVFKRVSKQEYMDKAAEEDAKIREEEEAAAANALGGDIEDLGISGNGAAAAAALRPKTGVVRKPKSMRQQAGTPATAGQLVARISELGPAPSPSDGYAAWLAHAKKIWALSRRLRALRRKAAEDGDEELLDEGWRASGAAGADGIGQYFARSGVTLSRGVWNILQWTETDTPGELKAWVLLGGQLHGVRVAVPRVLYVTSTVARQEIAGSRFFSEAKGMVLPRTAHNPQSMHLYRSVMTEPEYIAHQSSWSSFFAHPSIGGVYETEITPLDRALIQLGATAWMGAAARKAHAGRSSIGADVVSLDDLDTRRTALTMPHGLGKHMWRARDLSYALLFHAGSPDGRQFFALVMPYAARGHVWVVNTSQQAVQLQIPNLERLYRESYAAARAAVAKGEGAGGGTLDDGAFAYPDAIEFTSQAFSTTTGAYRAINAAVARCADERRASTVLIYHSAQPVGRLRSSIRSMSEFPTVPVPVHQADTVLPAIDWQRHACRRMVASLLSCSQWVEERISLAQYADVPVGNIPADAPMFLADVFFARKLALAKHVLWWSPSSKPDLGGRQNDEFTELVADDAGAGAGFTTSIEINVPGSYTTACVEIELRGLVINTILKAPLVNEIEGAFGVFGFDSAAGGSNDTAALLGEDDDGVPAAAIAGGADAHDDGAATGRGGPQRKKKSKSKDGESDQTSTQQAWTASGADGNVPVSTFQLLRSLLRGWFQEMSDHGNPFAEMMAEHFYRWLTRPNAHLFDPALAYLVRSLMRKVFLQMKAELQKLGARIVYANVDKLIVTTSKASVASAQAAVAYITKAIVEKPLFESLTLVPLQYWSLLLWMNASNYGGIVVQQQQQQQLASSDPASEPRIEMLWSMKEYLPAVVQSHFELAVAEFIYKLAGFHAQLHAKNPHAAHGGGGANGLQSAIIEDDQSDSEMGSGTQSQSGSGNGAQTAAAADTVTAAKGDFYRRLIGQYFTRKLLDTVGRIRDACSSAHRNDPATQFPRLPGSRLHRHGAARTEAALEFVKYVCTVFALDVPATNFVRIMRRNLLTLLGVGEFSDDARFANPCERLVLPRVVCDFCNFCRDMDFCRDSDLLPALAAAENGTTTASVGLPEWQCFGCGSAYDRVRIEERLIEQLHALLLSYQMQDLVCSRCRLMKQDNFSLQCTSCAGKYKPAVLSDAVCAQIGVYRDVAQMNGLQMLLDLANWAHSNTRGVSSGGSRHH